MKHFDEMASMKDEIDVMILCGGSATDLPVIGPKVAASFNTIDSFDTHAKIPEYFAAMDNASKKGNKISICLLYTSFLHPQKPYKTPTPSSPRYNIEKNRTDSQTTAPVPLSPLKLSLIHI